MSNRYPTQAQAVYIEARGRQHVVRPFDITPSDRAVLLHGLGQLLVTAKKAGVRYETAETITQRLQSLQCKRCDGHGCCMRSDVEAELCDQCDGSGWA